MPFLDIEAFENFLEALEGRHDEGSTTVTEAYLFVITDIKVFKKIKRRIYDKGSNNDVIKWLYIKTEIVIY